MRIVFPVVLLLIVIKAIACQARSEAVQDLIDNSTSNDTAHGSIWAVLVAGSRGYENYRHQADVLHAYHMLLHHGVPRNHIITMMYDDIAYSKDNPFPGQVFNIPGGPDVYSGVTINYHRDNVSAERFLDILTANHETRKQDKPVLKSSKNDNVFIYFSDHGGNGIICFQNDVLFADQLMNAINTMREKQMYKKMVIYVEACEAGSMFQHLPPQENVYVLTAARSMESSMACFWNSTFNAYLGDHFSVNWLLDVDRQNSSEETLEEQYSTLRRLTKFSQVMNYGEMAMSHDKIGKYQGMKKQKHSFNSKETIHFARKLLSKSEIVNQEDAHEKALMQQLEVASKNQKQEILSKLDKVVKHKATVKEILQRIINAENSNNEFVKKIETQNDEPINFECYRPLLKHFRNRCSHIIDFGTYDVIRHFYKFNNFCRHTVSVDFVKNAIDEACKTV